jgi:hypothetical protein
VPEVVALAMIWRVLRVPPEAPCLHRDHVATELWVAGGVGCVELRANDVQPPAAAVVRAVALY